jgi:hypothetical protein
MKNPIRPCEAVSCPQDEAQLVSFSIAEFETAGATSQALNARLPGFTGLSLMVGVFRGLTTNQPL